MSGCCGWSKEYPYIRLFSFSSFTTIPTETNALFYICLQNCRQFPNQFATINWQWDFNLLPKTRDYKKRDLWLTRQFNRSSKWNDKSNSSHPSRIAKGILCGVHSAGEKRQSGSRMEAPAAARRFGFTATHAQMTTKFAFARHDLWPLNAPAASFHSFFFRPLLYNTPPRCSLKACNSLSPIRPPQSPNPHLYLPVSLCCYFI